MKEFLEKHGVVLLVLVLALACMYYYSKSENADEIADWKVRAIQAERDKSDLEVKVKGFEVEQGKLAKEIAGKDSEIQSLRDQNAASDKKIADLETKAQAQKVEVRMLRTEDAVEKRFASTYPEVTRAKGFGVHDVEDDGIVVSYLMLPLWFAETFMIEHDKLNAAEGQIAEYRQIEVRYGTIDQLHQDKEKLQAKVLVLERKAKLAYQDGFNKAYDDGQMCRDRVVEELKKPRFQLPGTATAIGCAALGIAAGVGGIYLGKRF